jgi:LPXTG-motif cell wall-anchored protein
MAKKTAKTDEIKSRNELTKSMAQPDNTAQILASLQDSAVSTKSTTETGAKKGLSTGAIIGIAAGSLALLGLGAYLILKKKK